MSDFLTVLDTYGWPLATLILVVVAGVRRWFVFGWQFDQTKAERDEYLARLFDGMAITDTALTIAERKTKP